MRRLILLLAVLISLTPSNAYADEYPNILGIGGDKYLHFGVSAGGTFAIAYTLHVFSGYSNKYAAGIGGAGMMFAVGLMKEVMDAGDMPKGKQYLDGGDLTADAIGCAVGLAVFLWVAPNPEDWNKKGKKFILPQTFKAPNGGSAQGLALRINL